jgi:O-methyltransferase
VARELMIKHWIHWFFRLFGLDIIHFPPRELERPSDFRDDEVEIVQAVRPWTLTGPERIYALIQALRYITAHNIPGAIVECGVWKGGSMAAAARTLLQAGDVSRDLYLFDTFTGMSEPTVKDFDYSGVHANEVMRTDPSYRCEAPLVEVQQVLYATGYPREKIHFVKGKVEDTVPGSAPERIALLRLDTDWYESTKHELLHLYPRLSKAGVIIIDDYGHWRGSRQATDEYLAENRVAILLNRIDYTGRIGVKP